MSAIGTKLPTKLENVRCERKAEVPVINYSPPAVLRPEMITGIQPIDSFIYFWHQA